MGVGSSMEKDPYVLSRNNHFVTAVGSKGAQGISPSCLLSPIVSFCGCSLPEKLLGLHFPFCNVNYRDKTQVARFLVSIFPWWGVHLTGQFDLFGRLFMFSCLYVILIIFDRAFVFCHKMLRLILHVSLSHAWKLVIIPRKFPFDDVLNFHCYWPAVVSCPYLVSRALIFVLIFEF